MKEKKVVIGMLAHVDAGKTTLAESLLYLTGGLRRLGRVDHKDTFLDTHEIERARGITIFSKQAELQVEDMEITLLDTPGHADFSTEMERTLRVLDYAILVISGADGIQGHVKTLWKLLEIYEIPTFIFINKMDQISADRGRLLVEIRENLSESCITFAEELTEESLEQIAVTNEQVLEQYLEHGHIADTTIQNFIKQRKIFPCYFGSALKLQGVDNLLQGMARWFQGREYGEAFAAQVFKITRDEQGKRLTYLKITGGCLKVKAIIGEEKVDQIRIYSGVNYRTVQEVKSGTICAVTGLSATKVGDGIGQATDWHLPMLEPVLTYSIELPEEVSPYEFYGRLSQLQEEDPSLHIIWDKQSNQIQVQIMGKIQLEILRTIIAERFQVPVEFGSERIVYKETIQNTVVGIGHFEPLRHYAEVHLLLEAGERGSGIEVRNACSEEVLPKNFQNLVLTHIMEKEHIGVSIGAELTDVIITLLAGRGHQKHTEGGDFRQATYRAIRQGLMQAESVILEPYYSFKLEVPSEYTGRAIHDIQKMQGNFAEPEMQGSMTIIQGNAPVSTMREYHQEVIAYTKGFGKLSCTCTGYDSCHNREEVQGEYAYDAENDMDNPADSVFCAHGAGYAVPWRKVHDAAHVENPYLKLTRKEYIPEVRDASITEQWVDPEELEEIFIRTYGPIKREPNRFKRVRAVSEYRDDSYTRATKSKTQEKLENYLLVDGYNIIFAWKELKELATHNIEGARGKLMDILCNYQGYTKQTVILVFDAYKRKGNLGTVEQYHNINVVYTKEAETADAYIEKSVHQMRKTANITVATSDALEQLIIMGQGASRMSAQGLFEEITRVQKEIQVEHLEMQQPGKLNTLETILNQEKYKLKSTEE